MLTSFILTLCSFKNTHKLRQALFIFKIYLFLLTSFYIIIEKVYLRILMMCFLKIKYKQLLRNSPSWGILIHSLKLMHFSLKIV